MMMISTSSSNYFARTISPMIVDGTCGLILFLAALLIALPLVLRTLFYLAETSEINDREVNVSAVGKIATATRRSVSSSEETLLKSISYQVVAAKTSDSRLATDPESNDLSIVDMASLNYGVYRHQLIEASLKKHYNQNYAPGKVVFNFIELNATDSSSDEPSSRKYEAAFFDHIETAEDRRVEPRRVDPLDHFIPNRVKTTETVDRQTGTELEMEPASEVQGMEGETEFKAQTPTEFRAQTPMSSPKIRGPQRTVKNMRCLVKSPVVLNNSLSPMGSSALLSQNPVCAVYSSVRNSFPAPNRPKTEQLYRRDDDNPPADSKTHVDTRKYLKVIANNKNQANFF